MRARILRAKGIKSTIFFSVAVALVASMLVHLNAHAANTVPGSNSLVSVDNTDGQGGNESSRPDSISSDGSIVLFHSGATNLAGANSTSTYSLYERNINTGITNRVDVSTDGVGGNNQVNNAAMSENGRYVVFETYATNLIDGSTEPILQTYLHDMQTGVTTIISVNSTGSAIGNTYDNKPSWDIATSVSNDGRFVAIDSEVLAHYAISSTIRTGYYDVLLLDRSTNTWKMVDSPVTGSPQNLYSDDSQMSCDGSFIVFHSYASNLVTGGSTGDHIYLADLRDGSPQVTAISGAASTFPHISCNGDYIVYSTQNRTDVSPTPSGLDAYDHLVEYNRLTGSRSYIDNSGTTYNGAHNNSQTNGTTTTTDWFDPTVSDNGDAIFSYSYSTSSPRDMYLKHISDGSGTLEQIEKTSGGTYIPVAFSPSAQSASLSANGKYTTYPADAYALGLTTSDSGLADAIRSSTGL